MKLRSVAASICSLVAGLLLVSAPAAAEHSVARQWNELLLEAIRNDFARPTVHARNLHHATAAAWDAWAAYDPFAGQVFHHEKASAGDVGAARAEAISHAVYRILSHRFARSPGAATMLPRFDAKMVELGYDPADSDPIGERPAALGNRIADAVIAFGLADGSNEQNDYANRFYRPSNPPLVPGFPGNPLIFYPNRWQQLALLFFIDQAGNPFPVGLIPPALGPEWGALPPFALAPEDANVYPRGGFDYWVYLDPGPPPLLGGAGDTAYRDGFEQVIEWSGRLDPNDGVMIDISPNGRGNNPFGTNDGAGYAVNPKTGLPYAPQIVPAGDYYRVLAEFWADGPDSETPPGHWFTIANYVADQPELVKKVCGVGPKLDDLEYDVKLHLALGAAVYDASIAAWGAKGWYDYVRPISAIRYMADRGQSSDPGLPRYHPDGLRLRPGVIEQLTPETTAPGGRHEHLSDSGGNLGKIAVHAWRGPDAIDDPETTTAGVGWILAESWWPYQRPTFVTPPFSGYVSGHSTFSAAAALLMETFTGDPFFPGGIGEFHAPKDEFLVFEDGPSVDVTLQWATYRDASDETSISRIYGGIHPTADDIPGRYMGAAIAPKAMARAKSLFGPWRTLSADRVRAWPHGDGSGRISASGFLATGVHGDEDVLDLSEGLTVRIDNGGDVQGEVSFAPAECRKNANGARVCRRGATKAVFRKRSGGYRYQWNVDGAVPDAPEGPFFLRLTHGAVERAGVASKCREGVDPVTCHG